VNGYDWGTLVLVLLGAGTVAGLIGWTSLGSRIWSPVALALLAVTGLVAAAPSSVEVGGHVRVTLLAVLAGTLAVVGGGPVTARIFALVDRHEHTRPHEHRVADAGAVLRGGAWIGSLERAAVFASLAVAQPEGVAIVLALKGLGRYPELRAGASTGTAERFIIGTFSSVLWAAGCAGIVRLLV
jgi:hypothetical protein